MQEIEAKILEINRQEIIIKLAKANATKIFDGTISTLFLDYPDNQIHQKRDLLRLRKENQTAELTYKKVRFEKNAKVAEEISVQISNLEDALSILQNLGLTVKEKMEKHRTSYKLGEARIDIDCYGGEYAFIPEFLEIEAPAEEISKTATLLGFQEEDCLPWSTDELIKHYAGTKKEEV